MCRYWPEWTPDKHRCLQCKTGYYVTKSFACNSCDLSNCDRCYDSEDTSKCYQCSTDYYRNSASVCLKCDVDVPGCQTCQ